jgi:hypothetical protein
VVGGVVRPAPGAPGSWRPSCHRIGPCAGAWWPCPARRARRSPRAGPLPPCRPSPPWRPASPAACGPHLGQRGRVGDVGDRALDCVREGRSAMPPRLPAARGGPSRSGRSLVRLARVSVLRRGSASGRGGPAANRAEALTTRRPSAPSVRGRRPRARTRSAWTTGGADGRGAASVPRYFGPEGSRGGARHRAGRDAAGAALLASDLVAEALTGLLRSDGDAPRER